MKTLLALIVLLLGVSCNQDKTTSPKEIAVAAPLVTTAPDSNYEIVTENKREDSRPYKVKFDMFQIKEDVYDFMIQMELNNGAHFVSPNAKRDFSGKFTVQFDESPELELVSTLLETPPSVEEVDPHPFVNGTVNWVRENTTYSQRLQRTAEDDFHVKGFIQFTIEPRCTLEKVPFIIKYEGGKIRAELFGC